MTVLQTRRKQSVVSVCVNLEKSVIYIIAEMCDNVLVLLDH